MSDTPPGGRRGSIDVVLLLVVFVPLLLDPVADFDPDPDAVIDADAEAEAEADAAESELDATAVEAAASSEPAAAVEAAAADLSSCCCGCRRAKNNAPMFSSNEDLGHGHADDPTTKRRSRSEERIENRRQPCILGGSTVFVDCLLGLD